MAREQLGTTPSNPKDAATKGSVETALGGVPTTVGKDLVTAADAVAARAAVSAVGKGEIVYNVRDYGAVGDGVADDTAAVHAARDAAGVGGVVLFPPGTYKVGALAANVADQTWVMTGATLVYAGPFGLTGTGTLGLRISRACGITIPVPDVTLVGGTLDMSIVPDDKLGGWRGHGILLWPGDDFQSVTTTRPPADGVTIRDMTIINAPTHGIYAPNVERLTVTGCTFRNAAYSAVFTHNEQPNDPLGRTVLSDCFIADNTIVYDTYRSIEPTGIYIRAEERTAYRNFRVSRNLITVPVGIDPDVAEIPGQGSVIGGGNGIVAWHIKDSAFSNNTITGGVMGISMPHMQNSVISDNNVFGFYGIGIELGGFVKNVVVANNTLDGASQGFSSHVGIGGSGLARKADVRVATTTNGNLATAFANGQTVDGVTLATGDRILLKNQSNGAENGVYVVAASGAPTRSEDLNTSEEVVNRFWVFVTEGSVNGGTLWYQTAYPVTLGTTPLTFTEVNDLFTYKNVLITGNTIAGVAMAEGRTGDTRGISLGTNLNPDGVTISNNVIRTASDDDVFTGIYSNCASKNLSITGNFIDGLSKPNSRGIQFAGRTHVGMAITGNHFANCASAAFQIDLLNNLLAPGISAPDIRFGSFTDVRFTENLVRNCGAAIAGDGVVAATRLVLDNAPSLTTVSTSGGTTTLTASSAEVHRFTAFSNQTVRLPSANVIPGQRFTILNDSSGTLTVQASNESVIQTLPPGTSATLIALANTPTTNGNWRAVSNVSLTGNETLTNKVLTNPRITSVRDSNGSAYVSTNSSDFVYISPSGKDGLQVQSQGSPVANYLRASSQPAGVAPSLLAWGTDTKIDLALNTKGNGVVLANNVPVVTTTGTQTLSNKTFSGTASSSSGIDNILSVAPTIGQSGTAGYTGLLINPTETSTGSGTKRLIDAQVGGNSRFSVDNTGLATANSYVSTKTSTATAAGTTTLTIASAQVQEFTGTTTQTVVLPSTGVVAGQSYTIINNSTGQVSIWSSSGAALPIPASAGKTVVVMATIDTPTTASHWQVVSLTATTSFSGNPNTIAVRDGVADLAAVRFIPALTSFATSGGTTVISWAFSEIVVFTGTSNHTATLPSTNVVSGSRWTIINNSTGDITVNASGGATVTTLAAAAAKDFIALQTTPTTAAHWVVK